MNTIKEKKLIPAILITFFLIMIDQLTKVVAVNGLRNQSDIIIIPGVLQLHYLENTGAAFSMLEQKMTFFYILTPVLLLIILYFFLKLPTNNKKYRPLWIICVCLWAGAIGNYIDRINYKYVIDFIYFSLINFPVFNVADIYVTLSVITLFIVILFYYKEEELDVLMPYKKSK